LTPKEVESLKGRIQWYESYLFGRIANLAVHRIGKRVLSQPASRNTQLDAELKTALIFLKERINAGLPLELTAETENALLVFTDGAFEPTNDQPASTGGILVNPNGQVVSFFGAYLPPPLLEEFLAKSKHPIYELEIFPLLVAVKVWSTTVVGKLVVHYLDNDGARSAFVRAHASTDFGAALIAEYVEFEYKCRFSPWFARVACHSNP
jgi:hypothetical protein